MRPTLSPNPFSLGFSFLPILLALAAPASAESSAPPSAPAIDATQDDDKKAEFKERYDAAKGDREALWELHTWCDAFGMEREARKVLREILKVDDGDRKAHEGLGHIEHDGQWFNTQKDLDEYLAEQAEAEAKAKGFVQFKGEWVDPEHIPYLEKGMILSEDGVWLTPEQKQRIDEGWKRQDFEWVSPAEFESLDAGLWKCGDEWLSLEEADAYHAELGRWWKIPGDSFELWTTLPRGKALDALDVMDKTLRDLERFYGRRPSLMPRVVLLNSIDQYNSLAGGEYQDTETEYRGVSAIHTGYFAELWWDPKAGEFLRAAVAYWDPSTEVGDKFGMHAARYAAGMAFTEAIDPSLEFEAKFGKKLKGKKPNYKDRDVVSFWSEKQVPPFLRFGVPIWTERYFIDRNVEKGGDPHWARKWSVSNIESRGGIDPLAKVFEMELKADTQAQAAQSGKLLNQTGLIVSFIMDGEHEGVTQAHDTWRKAFNGEGDLGEATKALVEALIEAEADLRKFAKS